MLDYYAKSLRTYLELSPKEVAKLAKVSPESVELFERGDPLRLEYKQKILAVLYMRKASKYA